MSYLGTNLATEIRLLSQRADRAAKQFYWRKKKHKFKHKNSRGDIVRSYLKTFWLRFENAESENLKINILKEYADKVVYRRPKKSLYRKRGKFNKNKSYLRFFKKKCSVCSSTPVIRHHIIELQYGGNNSSFNIIPICSYCHSLVHDWLKTPEQLLQEDILTKEYLERLR